MNPQPGISNAESLKAQTLRLLMQSRDDLLSNGGLAADEGHPWLVGNEEIEIPYYALGVIQGLLQGSIPSFLAKSGLYAGVCKY